MNRNHTNEPTMKFVSDHLTSEKYHLTNLILFSLKDNFDYIIYFGVNLSTYVIKIDYFIESAPY